MVKSELTFEERFWAKVDKRDDNECWPWKGAKSKTGHGNMYHPDWKRAQPAYRISYEINKGIITEGKHILHSCDNGNCVNPNHLREGTHQENMKDMFDRNRNFPIPHYCGENHGMSKLTSEQVRQIKDEIVSRNSKYGTCQKLANEYNVDVSLISLIKRGKIWKHVNNSGT